MPNRPDDFSNDGAQGIEIDYCPTCRGVWLDRGELDKLIDASQPGTQAAPPPRQTYQQPQPPRYQDQGYRPSHNIHDSDDPSYKHYKRKKKGGFLGDLFDF